VPTGLGDYVAVTELTAWLDIDHFVLPSQLVPGAAGLGLAQNLGHPVARLPDHP
jgi:hypothetical protein